MGKRRGSSSSESGSESDDSAKHRKKSTIVPMKSGFSDRGSDYDVENPPVPPPQAPPRPGPPGRRPGMRPGPKRRGRKRRRKKKKGGGCKCCCCCIFMILLLTMLTVGGMYAAKPELLTQALQAIGVGDETIDNMGLPRMAEKSTSKGDDDSAETDSQG